MRFHIKDKEESQKCAFPAMWQNWVRPRNGLRATMDIERAVHATSRARPNAASTPQYFVQQPTRSQNRIHLQHKINIIGLGRPKRAGSVERRHGNNPHASGSDSCDGVMQQIDTGKIMAGKLLPRARNIAFFLHRKPIRQSRLDGKILAAILAPMNTPANPPRTVNMRPRLADYRDEKTQEKIRTGLMVPCRVSAQMTQNCSLSGWPPA